MYEDSTTEALGMLAFMILIVAAIVFSLSRDDKRKSRAQNIYTRRNPYPQQVPPGVQQVQQHQFDSSDFNTAAGLLAYIRENPDANEADLVGNVAGVINSAKQTKKRQMPQSRPQQPQENQMNPGYYNPAQGPQYPHQGQINRPVFGPQQPQYSPHREPAGMPEPRVIERPVYVEKPRYVEREPARRPEPRQPRRIRRDPYYDERRDDFYDEY